MHRTDSQVVVPLVKFRNFPTSPSCKHLPSVIVVVISSYDIVWGVFFLRCGRSHDSRVMARSRSVGYPTWHNLLMCRHAWPSWASLPFILLLPSPTSVFLFRSRAHRFPMSQGLLLPRLVWALVYLLLDTVIYASLLV